MYAIHIARKALKELMDIAEPFQSSIERKIDKLSANPFPPGVKKLQGYKDLWRIRIGDYRVIYKVDEAIKTVDISAIDHRKSVYR